MGDHEEFYVPVEVTFPCEGAQYSDEVTAFIDDPNNYAVAAPTLDPDMDAKAAYQAFTETNTLWTFCDPLINMGIETLSPPPRAGW